MSPTRSNVQQSNTSNQQSKNSYFITLKSDVLLNTFVVFHLLPLSGWAKHEFLLYNWINNSLQFRRQVSGIMNHVKEMTISTCRPTLRFRLYLKPYRCIHFYYVVYKC